MKKIVAFRPKESAVFTYRMTRPLSPLKTKFKKTLLRKNEKIRLKDLGERLKRQGDIWVIKYLKDFHTADILVTLAKETGAKLVIDIDDNLWQTPVGNIVRHSEGFAKYVSINTGLVECADYVTVSTEPLRLALKNLNENITVLPNLIDPADWKFKRSKHKRVRIGWIWSPTHTPDMEVVKEALNELHAKYGKRIEVIMFGAVQNMLDFPTTNIGGVYFHNYPKTLTEASIDISICPLLDNEFNRCKSNIKWMESTMAGAAVVASDVYPYTHSIKHGKTGYLAKNKNQWVKYIEWMIENNDLRKSIVKDAKAEVLAKYDVNNDTKWREFYESL